MQSLSKVKKLKKNKVLFIGFLDLKKNRGDSVHFSNLIQFMDNHFDVFTLTFGEKAFFGKNAFC